MSKIGLLHRGRVEEMDAVHELPVIDLVDMENAGKLARNKASSTL